MRKQQPFLFGIEYLEHLQAAGDEQICAWLGVRQCLNQQEADREVVVGELWLLHQTLELPLEQWLDAFLSIHKLDHHFEVKA